MINAALGRTRPAGEEAPVRAALFGLTQLESHARLLAQSHEVDPAPGTELLLRRLRDNQQVILESYRLVSVAVARGRQVAPAAEWLLDNHYLVEDHVEVARDYLPSGYSRELPRLRSGGHRGLPRVYDVAFELVAHTDGRADPESLAAFIQAYQSVTPLKLGELWAVPIMLRLAVIENLRRVAHRVAARRAQRDLALKWSQRFIEVVQDHPRNLITELADFVREGLPLTKPLVTELVSNLQGQHTALGLVLNWLEQQLAETGQTLEHVQQADSQEQTADQASIANSITTLRSLNSTDWRDFVEQQSVTEAALRRDPVGVYAEMDFASRDGYRHVVEHLARRSRCTESEVATQAVRLAAENHRQAHVDHRQCHVGYFLLEEGRRQLEQAVGYRVPLRLRVARWFVPQLLAWYLGAVLLVLVGLTAVPAALIWPLRSYGWGWAVLAVALLQLVLSRPAVALVNWTLTLLLPPRRLPRMNFAKAIPEGHRTAVAVPILLTSPASARSLVEGLELRYLVNRDANLRFVMLADLCDAPREHMPDDQSLLDAAREGIASLNAKYAPQDDRFFLLCRPRLWNACEGVWMGHERKRGKLVDFNLLLHQGDAEAFTTVVGDLRQLRSVRHVIVLDADTQLPPEAAWKLVAAMAHPLNRPRINPHTRCVEAGFGVLQPRVAISLLGAGRSRFARLFAGEVGIDPYTREVSNFYHDLFGRGQFIGKGIYDVEAFQTAVGERFPDNAILSHDLLEGVHARCGFVNDVELIEDHPSQYLADVSRRQRWVRGDWQIAPWLLGRVPGPRGKRQPNPLDALSRWMILDNLRRSLLPGALLAALVGAVIAPLPYVSWCLLSLLGLWFLPDALRTAVAVLRKPQRVPWNLHLLRVGSGECRQVATELLHLAFLPFESVVFLGAIARAAWRKCVSHRRLLEWQTTHTANRLARGGLGRHYLDMLANPMLAGTLLAGLAWARPWALAPAVPLLALWLLGPWLAWWISRPLAPRQPQFTAEHRGLLHRLARRTWAYFEQHVGPATQWLAPDNFQEHPRSVLAERTSPTNLGLGVLSVLAANDFGYVSTGDLIERTQRAFASMEQMRRYRGHFFNWYSTRDLEPLHPLYISSVDSGNLCAHLITLRSGLLELREQPILPPQWRQGLRDTLDVLRDELHQARTARGAPPAPLTDLGEILDGIAVRLEGEDHSTAAMLAVLQQAEQDLARPATEPIVDTEVLLWITALQRHLMDLRSDLTYLLPWLSNNHGGLMQTPREQLSPAVPQELQQELRRLPSLAELATLENRWGPQLDGLLSQTQRTEAASDLRRWRQALRDAAERAAQRITTLQDLAQRADELAEMDLDFLYDSSRKLLSIGFSVENRSPDSGSYDLLASEARLCSYLGVAQNQLPQEHWFLLGRQAAPGSGPLTLVSWSGSMFEYLMPLLVMPSYEGTLLHRTMYGAVRRQVRYGRRLGVPWGVSESCYNQLDRDMTYQYRAFGVPDLGLKRGLADDVVVSPYAAVMALMVMPEQAAANIAEMARLGLVGRCGLYEAVDYTPSRVPAGQDSVVVRAFMAHHSGMSLLALDYVLRDRPMQRRFLADPEFRAAQVLLHERVPVSERARLLSSSLSAQTNANRDGASSAAVVRVFQQEELADAWPHVHLLSNGRYSVMLTAAGAGYSRWHNIALTRWREDPTSDAWGTFFYVCDVERQRTWSITHQPCVAPLERYEAIFAQGRVEFHAVQHQVETSMLIAVSPEDDIELRRIRLTNTSRRTRTLELTSFSELVLMDARADAAHPAFHNLFVETQLLRERSAIMATRRPRSHGEEPPWMFHAIVAHGVHGEEVLSFETDRLRFLGRQRNAARPQALDQPGPLSNTAGAVLDPSMAIRHRVRLAPGESITLDAITGAAQTREQAMLLLDRYQDRRFADRVFETAWTHSHVLLHHLHASEADAELFARLAGAILYANPRRRAPASLIARNRKGQSDLWSYGISGDLPIVLVRLSDHSGLGLVRQLVQAHGYWRHKGLRVDLVIWSDAYAGYRQSLHDEVIGLINSSTEAKMLDQSAGIFVRNTDQLPEDDRLLLQAAARVVLNDRAGSLAEQVRRHGRPHPPIPALNPVRRPEAPMIGERELPPRDLVCDNGLGGFTPDGREYVVILKPGKVTPAPWVNVIANANFGTVVSESGGGYTWFQNAHEFRLTPWTNDPVVDPPGEAYYIRDEESGSFWSPTAAPAGGGTPYVCRHGLGYTAFEHTQHGVFSEMMVYVAVDAPVKLCALTLRNLSGRTRRLSVTGCVDWVLGESRQQNAMHIVSQADPQTGALFATNAYAFDFPGRVAFYQCSTADRSVTSDRTEFLGRHGSLASPQAMTRKQLSNRVGAGVDPCAAIQAYIEIPAGEARQMVFCLGAAGSQGEVRALLQRFSGVGGARQALEAVWETWKRLLGGVYVETPDPTVNVLVNNWLLYQVLSCRFWGRSGFYQSGGAFGFRDQLQDSMAFLYECPWLARGHLLLAATRQFRDGDVQHWWHPPTGRGVRTRISDDYLWLPLAVCRYVKGTGDTGVLEEQLPFLDGRPVPDQEESYYDRPAVSDHRASLYEHCVLALRRGMRLGAHGLPLMGAGDWNDGMNRVGLEGRGESVWLAFFLIHVLRQFIPIAHQRADAEFAGECEQWAAKLQQNVAAHGWDGRWYRRAFFDDGRPLGSSQSPECRIDILPQAWAVLSAAADEQRAHQAMDSAIEQLVDEKLRLIRLFDPPFDKHDWDPGYIKGYVPGVRENGGQYTHAAVWAVMAAAQLGRAEQAWKLFELINPVRHGDTKQHVQTYKVEPYVLAGDVYTLPGHEGRGGWTWYTGSASWMYRLILESLLGLELEVDTLTVRPLLPPHWGGFKLHYRFGSTMYHLDIVVLGPDTRQVGKLLVDQQLQPDGRIHMVDDRREHYVRVEVGGRT